MQKQKQKDSEDNLLRKRADSHSGQREMKIKECSWSFRPCLTHTLGTKVKTDVPTLDKIGAVYMENKGSDVEDIKDEDISSKSGNHETVAETYRMLLTYAMSDEYRSSVQPAGTKKTECELKPFLFLTLESKNGDVAYGSLPDPFRTPNMSRLMAASDNDELVQIKYTAGDPTISVGDSEYTLTHLRSSDQNDSLEKSLTESLDAIDSQDSFIRSEYECWAKVNVENIHSENSQTFIETDDGEINWAFDEPVVWDKNEEDCVKLLENFANGDSSQLDHIYVRPTNPTVEDIEFETKEHATKCWEIALEPPDIEEVENDMPVAETLFVATLLILFSLSIFLILVATMPT